MSESRQRGRRRGRAPLLDERTHRLVVLAVRRGNRLSVAARLAGVGPQTVREWVRRGRGADRRPTERRYVEFVDAIELARSQAEAEAVEAIWWALPHRPDFCRWFLGLRSEEWRRHRLGPAPVTAIPTPPPNPGGTIVMVVPVEEIERRVREIEARGHANGA